VSTITYALIALSIVVGVFAVCTTVAIVWSERRARSDAYARLKAMAELLQDGLVPKNRSVDEATAQLIGNSLEDWSDRTSDDWKNILEDEDQAREIKRAIEQLKHREDDRGEISLRDIFWRLSGEEERRAGRAEQAGIRGAKHEESLYIAWRGLVLSLLDDLSLESVLLDPRLRGRLDAVLGAFPPAPSELSAPWLRG
jgi:hypothetical protein